MRYEVEQKHRIDYERGDVRILLAGHGARLGDPIDQIDIYFAHPCREFSKTDEALRIRTENGKSFLTYKGPRIDSMTKTRQEIELPLDASVTPTKLQELLQALGFSIVATVSKERRPFTIHFQGRDVQGAYDLVHKLGPFVELELVVDESEVDEAKSIIEQLAKKLDLGPAVWLSYLELLLDYPLMRPKK